MICSHCSFENANTARFCQNCGKPLQRACSNCSTLNAPEARFCTHCGTSLQAPAPAKSNSLTIDPRLERLAATTPNPLAEKMRLSTSLAGERRIVTALFADVVGSTSLAEQLDPEDWTIIMNQAFDRLVPIIYRYEGTIARLMGDALLSFFGAPVTHEDDPIRGVHAALELIQAAQEYAYEVRQSYGIDFAIRVGINTGPVVVGEVGSNLVYEYTAMGDAVNLAARMQTAARPMTVLITEHTHRFVEPVFEFIDQGSIKVRGRAEPVRAYEVTGPRYRPGRLRGLEGLFSPLVGRDRELNILFQATAALQAGIGRIVLISSDAGVGKSRLVSEWQPAAMREGSPTGLWATGHCLSYGQRLPYHLLIDLLHSLINVSENASETEKTLALQELLAKLFPEPAGDYDLYLRHLLSLHMSDQEHKIVQKMDPQAIQTQYLQAFRAVVNRLTLRQPLTIILEDLHWADPSSISLLRRVGPLVREIPLLVCITTRPERGTEGWKLVSEIRAELGGSLIELNLQPLSEDESCELVSNLLDETRLPDSLREMILKKTEGNPLFVEEIIRMLIERGVLVRTDQGWRTDGRVQDVRIPDTVQGLVLARIDRLPEEVKQTLRIAAVIGRQFPLKVLEEVLEGESG